MQGYKVVATARGPAGSGKTQRLRQLARKYEARGKKTLIEEGLLQGGVPVEKLWVSNK